MLKIERKIYLFIIKDIWWATEPYNVEGYDSVTFYSCKNRINMEGFSCVKFTTLIIDLDQDLDIIWKNMDKSSCRYAINRAKKDGIKIRLNQNYEEFYEINKSFKKNKNLPTGFENIDFMKKYGTLFISEIDGEILGGQLFLEDESHIRWLIGASKRLEVDKKRATLIGNANRLMIWQAINYAKEKKIKEFDMGGYYTGKTKDEQKNRINIFKKSFGGNLVTQYIYRKDNSNIYKVLRYLYDQRS